MNIFYLLKTTICLIFFVNAVCGFQTITSEDISNVPASLLQVDKQNENEILVEVSIICDKDFGTIFQYNKTKILEYWKALFFDVHQRFQTLPSVNISFSVLSIFIVDTEDEQPYIERYKNGTVQLYDALPNFQKWLYTDIPYVSDIVILATGASSVNETAGVASFLGACMTDFDNYRVLNSLMISIRSNDLAGTLAHEIAHTLGAHHENEESYSTFDCGAYNSTNYQFLMEAEGVVEEANYFFSNCTDRIISVVLQLEHKNCLKHENSGVQPLFITSALSNLVPMSSTSYVAGISIQEQCQLLVNNSRGYVLPMDAHCEFSNCRVNTTSGEGLADEFNFRPFDGSPCDEFNNGICFRGLCLPKGLQLINVATGECLASTNTSISSDKPILKKCLTTGAPSPFDLMRILIKAENRTVLFMVYSSPKESLSFGKCLVLKESAEGTIFGPGFERCNASTLFDWDMIPVQEGEFLFRHRETQRCLTTTLTNKAEISSGSNCSSADTGMVWKLLNEDGTALSVDEIAAVDLTLYFLIFIFVLLFVIFFRVALEFSRFSNSPFI